MSHFNRKWDSSNWEGLNAPPCYQGPIPHDIYAFFKILKYTIWSRPAALDKGEGKTMSLLSASFRRRSRQKLAESREDFCFLRGKCTKLGEGDT